MSGLVLDTFAGAGGASLGLASLGLDPIGFELDADACATHAAAGLRTVRADLSSYPWPEHLRGRVDVLHSSPPCQPWSAGGRQRGADDPRDGIPWLLRAVEELEPRLLTVENVAGLTYRKHRPYLDAFVEALEALGYDVEWRVLNAADYGVPQTRKRLLVVARRDGVAIKWPDPTHAKGGADGRLPWVTMAEALGWGMTERPFGTVAGCNTSGGFDPWGVGGSGARERLVTERDEGRWLLNTGRDWKPGGTRLDAQTRDTDEPAPTVSAVVRVPAPGHHAEDESGSQMRDAVRVTLDELAALQGFPPDYPFTGTRTSRARQIGNALPPALIAAAVGANLGGDAVSSTVQPFDETLLEEPSYREPGGYRRRGPDGPPFVLDPTGARTKAGKVRSLLYGRPSGFHRWIENGYALERWSERMVLVGLCRLVGSGELDVDAELEDADALVARAKHVAGADLSAARGTAAHEATHRLHDLERAEGDVIAGLADLGFAQELVDAILLAYEDCLARWGLEILASEVKVVDDVWRLAGTADRFVRLTRELRFGDVVLPAGLVVVLDLKTGKLRVRGGEVLYWNGYLVQLRSYAHGCLYVIEGDEERREPFPWDVDQTSGLILHVDIAGALDTDVVTASLWWADLQTGAILGELACAARDASTVRGVLAQCSEGPLARTVEVPGASRLELELAASLELVERRELRAWLQGRIDVIGAHERARADLARRWPAGVVALRTSEEHTDAELAAIEAALDKVETDHSVPFGPSRPGTPDDPSRGWLVRLLDSFPGSTIHETREEAQT